jgi:hypothetical protein
MQIDEKPNGRAMDPAAATLTVRIERPECIDRRRTSQQIYDDLGHPLRTNRRRLVLPYGPRLARPSTGRVR